MSDQGGGNQFSGEGPGTWETEESTEGYNPFAPAVIVGQEGNPPASEPDVSGETLLSDIDYLRMLVQEPIPSGGSDADTMFLNEQLVAILNRSSNLMSYAAYTAWSIKTGALLILTDRNDGLSEKKLSQAAVAAQKQANMWLGIAQNDMQQFARTVGSGGAVFRPWDRGLQDMWNQIWDVTHIDRFWLPWNVVES